MRVSRIAADWLATLMAAASAPIPTLCAAKTDGDEIAPDRITIVVSEEVDPVAKPLHIYDLLLEIRTPSATNLTSAQHASVEAWLDTVLASGTNYNSLKTALTPIGTMHDWFVGKDGRAARYETAIVTERTVRLAVDHTQ